MTSTLRPLVATHPNGLCGRGGDGRNAQLELAYLSAANFRFSEAKKFFAG